MKRLKKRKMIKRDPIARAMHTDRQFRKPLIRNRKAYDRNVGRPRDDEAV